MKDYKEEVMEIKNCIDCPYRFNIGAFEQNCGKYLKVINNIKKRQEYCKVVRICIIIEIK